MGIGHPKALTLQDPQGLHDMFHDMFVHESDHQTVN